MAENTREQITYDILHMTADKKVNLLILTQKIDINDPILGFFHRWTEEFAKHCNKLTVVCLWEGEHHLPENVKVLSLGKEQPNVSSKMLIVKKLRYVLNFYRYIWQERKNYDSIFVHMNPIYLVWGGLFWRMLRKRTSLWYTHKNVDLKLRIAEKFSNTIFSASKESFRMSTKKLQVVGHGIPVEVFKNQRSSDYKLEDKLKIISAGRITEIKNLDTLIKASGILKKKGLSFEVSLIGPTMGEGDKEYFEHLKTLVLKHDVTEEVKFLGSVPNNKIAQYYWKNDLSINLAPTGGVDKATLESMASGLLVLASNIAFDEYFGKYKDILMFKEKDEKDLAEKIINLVSRNDLGGIRNFLVSSVKENTDLPVLVDKIISKI